MSTHSTPTPTPWRPTSGQLLREVVTAFRLDDAEVGGPRAASTLDRKDHLAKRYFAGEWLGPDQRKTVCAAVVDALSHSGILPPLDLRVDGDGNDTPAAARLADALVAWLAWWDRDFFATVRSCPAVADCALTAFALARPMVIDTALRLSGALVVLGLDAPRSTPAWLDRLGGARLLRAVLQDHWPNQTHDVYFAAFGVNERTFDRWISPTVDSEIPLSKNIDRIAEVLATKSGSPSNSIRARLRREYGLFALLRCTAGAMGWPLAIHLATALLRMVADARSYTAEKPLDDAARTGSLSLLHGSRLQVNRAVLATLLERGSKSTPWADELRAARDGHVRERITRCLRALASVPTGDPPGLPGDGSAPTEMRRALLEKFVVEVWMRDDVLERAANAPAVPHDSEEQGLPVDAAKLRTGVLIWRAESAAAKRDFDSAAPAWRCVVELESADATHRFQYGAVLWQGGHVDEAEAQLRMSCELAPDWDRPFVELGILWLNTGEFDRALAHLQSGDDRFIASSDHFNHKEGVVLWKLGRIEEALASLERAVELNSEHAEALDLAARCAFMLLDSVKGRTYARRAMHLGRHWSWREFCA